MSVADLMRRMSDAGAPMEAIIIAVEAIEATERKLADQRAQAAARKQRQRDRDRDSPGTVTGQSRDAGVTGNAPPPLSPPSPNTPHTPQEPQPPLTPPHETASARTRRATRLAEDWQPAPLPLELARIVAAWAPGMIERELSKFRDWAASAPGDKGLKRDWDAAWRNWLRKADEQHGKHRTDGRREAFDDQPRDPMVRAYFAREAERSGAVDGEPF